MKKNLLFATSVLFWGLSVSLAFAQIDKGDIAMKANKYDEAYIAFGNAVKANPKDDVALLKFGEAALATDQYSDAMEALDRAIELNPKNAMAYYRHAQLSQVLERNDDCLKDLTSAIENDGTKPEFYLFRASIFLGASLNDQAIADFNSAIAKGVNKPEVYYNRAIAYYQAGKLQEARKDCDQAIQMDPNSAEQYIMRSQLRLTDFDLDGSCADGKKGLELMKQPFNDTLMPYCNNRTYNTYMQLAVEFEQKQLFEAAAKGYSKALQVAPDSFQVYVSRGAMYQNLQQYDKAEADYKLAEQKGIKNELLFYNWGLMKLLLKDYAKAKTCFDKVIEKVPNEAGIANIYFQRGFCKKNSDDLSGALADFNTAIQKDTAQYAAYAHRAYIEIAKKEFAKAKADAEKSIQIFPDYAYGFLMRAQSKVALKETDFCDDFTRAHDLGAEEAEEAKKLYCK
ncbi:MAG: hypothetical protein RI894_699 [Bacteroidota bacterium]|jgi:tetratricopeptide (TPR) repeat protein